ncbi:uncharacterized protein VTP21DRAFT_5141 [Calcarisporiella thermophila]|uniref:uncharacterized protein n=1 Tax=Calcarisporiella thermophila TaxID=911321 RepID=UPI003743AFA3
MKCPLYKLDLPLQTEAELFGECFKGSDGTKHDILILRTLPHVVYIVYAGVIRQIYNMHVEITSMVTAIDNEQHNLYILTADETIYRVPVVLNLKDEISALPWQHMPKIYGPSELKDCIVGKYPGIIYLTPAPKGQEFFALLQDGSMIPPLKISDYSVGDLRLDDKCRCHLLVQPTSPGAHELDGTMMGIETEMFTHLFGEDRCLSDAPIVLTGWESGVVYFHTVHGRDPPTLVLRLAEPIAAIHVLQKSPSRTEEQHQLRNKKDAESMDVLVVIGKMGTVAMLMMSGDLSHRKLVQREYHFPPVVLDSVLVEKDQLYLSVNNGQVIHLWIEEHATQPASSHHSVNHRRVEVLPRRIAKLWRGRLAIHAATDTGRLFAIELAHLRDKSCATSISDLRGKIRQYSASLVDTGDTIKKFENKIQRVHELLASENQQLQEIQRLRNMAIGRKKSEANTTEIFFCSCEPYTPPRPLVGRAEYAVYIKIKISSKVREGFLNGQWALVLNIEPLDDSSRLNKRSVAQKGQSHCIPWEELSESGSADVMQWERIIRIDLHSISPPFSALAYLHYRMPGEGPWLRSDDLDGTPTLSLPSQGAQFPLIWRRFDALNYIRPVIIKVSLLHYGTSEEKQVKVVELMFNIKGSEDGYLRLLPTLLSECDCGEAMENIIVSAERAEFLTVLSSDPVELDLKKVSEETSRTEEALPVCLRVTCACPYSLLQVHESLIYRLQCLTEPTHTGFDSAQSGTSVGHWYTHRPDTLFLSALDQAYQSYVGSECQESLISREWSDKEKSGEIMVEYGRRELYRVIGRMELKGADIII